MEGWGRKWLGGEGEIELVSKSDVKRLELGSKVASGEGKIELWSKSDVKR